MTFSPDFRHDLTIFAAVQGGILRSTDGGDHWQVDRLPSPPPMASGLVVSPNYPVDGQVFCATVEDGVFISRDRGLYWASWNFGLLDLQILCLAISPQFAQDQTLIVGAESGIFLSKNGGRAWKAVDFPVGSAPVTSLGFSMAYEVDNIIFAGTVNGELFRSINRGGLWEVISQFDEGIDQILIGKNSQRNPEILVLEGSRLHYSADEGQSWKKCRIPLPAGDYMTCLAVPTGISIGSPILVGMAKHGMKVTKFT